MNFDELLEQLYGAPLKVKFSVISLMVMTILPFMSSILIVSYSAFFNEQVLQWDTTMLFFMGLLCFFLTSMSLASTTIVSVACGYFFGWNSYPILLGMFTLGTWFGYTFSNWFDKNTIMNFIKMNPEMYKFVKKLQKNERLMLFTMRLTPSLPFAVTNFFCSYIEIPLQKYLIYGTIGIAMRLTATVWVGTQIQSFNENLEEDPTYQLQKYVFIGVALVLFSALYYYVMREKDEVE